MTFKTVIYTYLFIYCIEFWKKTVLPNQGIQKSPPADIVTITFSIQKTFFSLSQRTWLFCSFFHYIPDYWSHKSLSNHTHKTLSLPLQFLESSNHLVKWKHRLVFLLKPNKNLNDWKIFLKNWCPVNLTSQPDKSGGLKTKNNSIL